VEKRGLDKPNKKGVTEITKLQERRKKLGKRHTWKEERSNLSGFPRGGSFPGFTGKKLWKAESRDERIDEF